MQKVRGRHGRNRVVISFTNTRAISAYRHYSCDFEPRSIQYYVMKFVGDLV